MTRLIGLYPKPWRDRYETEFRDVLAERPPTLSDRFDIVRGAFEERLRPQVPGPRRVRDRIGISPLVGFAVLIGAGVIAANGPVRYDSYGMYRDGALGLPFLVASMVLLSIGLHRVMDRLPAGAAVPRAAAWMGIVLGPIWAFMPWVIPLGLGFVIGVLGLAVGARRSGIWPAWSEIVLVATLVGPAGLLLALQFLPWYTMREADIDFSLVLLPISAIWLVVGGLVLRGTPRVSAAQTSAA